MPQPKNDQKPRYLHEVAEVDRAKALADFKVSRRFDQLLARTIEITPDMVDKEKRTIEFSISSESPIPEWFGNTILEHTKQAVDLSRANQKAPVRDDFHWFGKHIGIMERAWIEDKKVRVIARFSRNPQAEEVWQDVLDGIRVHVSVGATVQEWEITRTEDDNTPDIWRAKRWTVHEVVMASDPKDISVGIGRSASASTSIPKEKTMNKQQYDALIARRTAGESLTEVEAAQVAAFEAGTQIARAAAPAPAPAPVIQPAPTVQRDFVAEERLRVKDIRDIARNFRSSEEIQRLAETAESDGSTPAEFNGKVLALLGRSQAPAPSAPAVGSDDLGMDRASLSQYSLSRAVLGNKLGKLDGVEKEAHDALARKWGSKMKTHKGVLIPREVLNHMARTVMGNVARTQTVGSFTAGGALVREENIGFVDLLRASAVTLGMGVQIVEGLEGDVYLNRKTGSLTGYWVPESGAVTRSNVSLGRIHMQPKVAGAANEMSRKTLLQTNPAIDQIVFQDIMETLLLLIDAAVIAGSGVNGEPTGIINTTGVGSVNGASFNHADAVEFETDLAAANALGLGMPQFLTTPTIRGTLKTRDKGTDTGKFIWEDGDRMNGYGAKVSTQVPASHTIFGIFQQVLVGMWGPIEIKHFDAGENYLAGAEELVGWAAVDVALRNPAAFSVSTAFS